MSPTQLAVNTILFLYFGLHIGASDSLRDSSLCEIAVANPEKRLAIIDSKNTQPVLSKRVGKAKKTGKTKKQQSKQGILQTKPNNESNCVVSISDTDVDENQEVRHHQIHKRYLNKDFPLNRMIDYGEPQMSLFHNSNPVKLAQPAKLSRLSGFSSGGDEKTSRGFEDKIVLNDSFRLDDSGSFSAYNNDRNYARNDTTKNLLKDSYSFVDICHKCDTGPDTNAIINQNYINPLNDEVIDFISRPSGNTNTIDLFSIDTLNRKHNKSIKREATETTRNSSYDTTAIKQEIDKVYKDISENVRLLSKLRDRESHLLKKPLKKRWIIVDNTVDGLGGTDDNERKRRCNQELTVEMDTNRETTPDRLEHIERKIEEEVLQVNVPLRCNH